MLETIREFAREHLEASGEEDALRRLQTEWLLELADRAGTRANCRRPRQVGRRSRRARDRQRPRRARLGGRTRPRAWPRPGRVARGLLARSRTQRGRVTSRATARTNPGRRTGASRPRLAGTRRCARPLRRIRTGRALLPAEPRALRRKRRRDPDGEPPLPRRWTHGDDGRDGRRLAAARGITPYVPAARPASRRGPGTRIPRGEGVRRGRSGARDRALARERRDRPRDWAGSGGRAGSSARPPNSSASAETLDAAEGSCAPLPRALPRPR